MAAADHDLHTLAGPYVLDAVTPRERTRFASHLADCGQCRDEVRELRETATRLAMAVAVRPRPELKEQTIRAASQVSQLGPVLLRERTARRVALRLGLAAAVLVVAVSIGLGVITGSTMRQLHRSQRQEQMIAAVLNAPDAVMLTAKVSTGGMATVVMSHRQHAMVFTAHGLRTLPAAEGYELWLMGPSGDRPAGMLKPRPGGMAGPMIVAGLGSGDMIGLTVEPTSGSPRPTSAPLMLIGARRVPPGRTG